MIKLLSDKKISKFQYPEKGHFILGHLDKVTGENNLSFFLENWKKYGDIVEYKVPLSLLTVIANADVIKQISLRDDIFYKGMSYFTFRKMTGNGVITSEGDIWKTSRSVLDGQFTPKSVTQYRELIFILTSQMIERLKNSPIELSSCMRVMTFELFFRVLFGIKAQVDFHSVSLAFSEMMHFIAKKAMNPLGVPLFIPIEEHRKFKKNLNIVHQSVWEGMKECKYENCLFSNIYQKSKNILSEKQLHNELVGLILAGHETTAQVLTWSFYQLAKNEQLYEDLCIEARSQSQSNEKQLMFINEILRLYPPVPQIPRDVKEDISIADVVYKKNTTLLISLYMLHRHPLLWPNPEVLDFSNQKFLKTNSVRHTHQFLPFGLGRRSCLGVHFAYLELDIILKTFNQNLQFKLNYPEENIKEVFKGTLLPEKEINGIFQEVNKI